MECVNCIGCGRDVYVEPDMAAYALCRTCRTPGLTQVREAGRRQRPKHLAEFTCDFSDDGLAEERELAGMCMTIQ